MPTLVTDNLPELAELLGTLPGGDVPAAWYVSVEPEVLKAYQDFKDDHAAWRKRMDHLIEISGLKTGSEAPERIRMSGIGNDWLVGLYPPPGLTGTPKGWRQTSQGWMTPRKKTKAEKASEINQAFQACRRIPRAVDFMPGMPNTLWLPGAAWPVHIRKPARAVMAFLGGDPDRADVPFEPDPQLWQRMRLSLYHMLRERQQAAGVGQ